jgi:hypothetical protein
MNILESENDRHAGDLAAKVSRLKNVSSYLFESCLLINIFFIFKIAIDIDNETKEHNRFLESMVRVLLVEKFHLK